MYELTFISQITCDLAIPLSSMNDIESYEHFLGIPTFFLFYFNPTNY